MKKVVAKVKGFSLIELMVTMLVFGIVIGVIYRILISSTKSVSKGKMAASVQQNLRVGMDDMLKDIRQAGYGIGALPAFTVAAKRDIRFWADVDKKPPTNLIRYYVGNASDLSGTPNPNDAYLYKVDSGLSGLGPIPIAQGVRSVEFRYYDGNGVALLNGTGNAAKVESDIKIADKNKNGSPDINDIRQVEIILLFEAETPDPKISYNNGYLQYSLTTKLYPINLELLKAQGKPDNLLSVTITPDPAPTILPATQLQFFAIANYQNSGTRDVTDLTVWTSTDTSVASIGSYVAGSITYNDEGLAKGKKTGITTIKCAYGGKASSNSVPLKVGGPATTDVRINGSKNYAMLVGSATTVTLTATISDIGFGSNKIIAAQYSVPSKSLTASMAAADGSFNSPTENVVATVNISGWSDKQSPYTFFVQGRSADAPTSWGPAESAVLTLLKSDNLGPVVENMTASPSPIIPEGTPSVTINANINDSPRGGSKIAAAELFINKLGTPGTGSAMTPVDGVLNSPFEAVKLTLNTSAWRQIESPYRIYIIGRDIAGNWGPESALDITVQNTDNKGPLVTSITGPGSVPVGTAFVTISGSASDATMGGSKIVAVEAFADTDPGLGKAQAMSPVDGTFDSPDEGFQGNVSSFPWAVGTTHTIYARAKDEVGNWGPTNSVLVTVSSSLNGKDAVIALNNGSFEVWNGDGVGGFKGKSTYITGVSITDLVLVDLNGDANSDVVLGASDGKIQVWMNDGFGSLGISPAQVLSTDSTVTSVIAADLNKDGKLDILASSLNGSLKYYQNNGSGTLSLSSFLGYDPGGLKIVYRAAAADFNGDSHLDVVLAGRGSGSTDYRVRALRHPGAAGGNWIKTDEKAYVGSVAGVDAADYTKDGKMDFILALNDGVSGIQVWSGRGDGQFDAMPLQVWSDFILSLRTQDYDKNGSPDVLLGTSGSSGKQIYVSPNNGSGYFDTVNPYKVVVGTPVATAGFGHMDGDTDVDVVSAGTSSGKLYTFIHQPSHELLKTINSPFLSSAPAVVLRIGEIGN